MSTINLTTETVIGLAAGDTLVLPSNQESQVSVSVVGGSATLSGKVNGTEGNHSLAAGNYVLSNSGGQNASWFLVNGADSSSGVTSIVAGTNITIDPVGGTGDVTINASGSGSGFLKNTRVQILAAATDTLFTNPVELLAGQGLGTIAIPVSIVIVKSGTPYASGADNLIVQVDTAQFIGSETTGYLTNSDTIYMIGNGRFDTLYAQANLINQPIMLTADSNPSTGSLNLTVDLQYIVLDYN